MVLMFPLTFTDLARITQGELINFAAVKGSAHNVSSFENVSIDTRSLSAGDLFVALNGPRYDGHDFLKDAFEHGAAGAVVCSNYCEAETVTGKPVIAVQETLQAMQDLARWNCKQSDALTIGITGSVGKTTTRHMIHTVLSESFAGIQSPRNYNNQIGVPLSLLQLNEEHEFGVIEFGASAPGEISELASWAEPDFGVLTRIGPAHLESFGSLETVIQSKAELIDAIAQNGLIFLPEETARIPEIRRRLPPGAITTGQSKECHLCAQDIRFQKGWLNFSVDGESFRLQVPGKHFLDSALITIGLARELGMTSNQIQNGLDQFQPVPGRCELRMIGSWTVLNDCYNASPLSVTAGLESLCELAGVKHRIAVLGDMLGLGNQSEYYHHEVGKQVANFNIDFLITYGSYACDVASGAHQAGMSPSRIGAFDDFEAMQEILSLWLDKQSAILLKGSRNMQMERLLGWLENQAQSQPIPQRSLRSELNYRKAS